MKPFAWMAGLCGVLAMAFGVTAQTTQPGRAVEHVVHVSVDGLGGDRLGKLLEIDSARRPRFGTYRRLIAEGASTLNARTDYTHTSTLPNHVAMVTGRPVTRSKGWPATSHHGYAHNGTPGPGWTLHNRGNPEAGYIAGVFDVAHDHGRRTALLAAEDKFIVFDRSYDPEHGAPDRVGEDHGRDKIDAYFYHDDAKTLTDRAIALLREDSPHYLFFHLRDPDRVGYEHGWGSNEWVDAVAETDRQLGRLLAFVEGDPGLRGRTAIVLTAAHGGAGEGHSDPAVAGHYTVPVIVWGAGVAKGADLYALNFRRRVNPGGGRPGFTTPRQPIRNGGTGNLALKLLGLPAIPGSSINAKQDLAVK